MRPRVLVAIVCLALLGASACTYRTEEVVPRIPANAQSSKLFAADGTLITTLHGEENRLEVPLDAIPLVLQRAVIAIEDERFYDHPGVDVRALFRAAQRNAEAGAVAQGGSTITQQLIKQTLLNSGKTLDRKLQELSLAIELERHYSKDRILTIYLNTIYFGNGAHGVEAASETYFAKQVGQLSAAEAATLAGMIQAPSAYDPLRFPDAALARRDVVLDKMLDQGYLGPQEHAAAKASPLGVQPTPSEQRYPAAHFVDEVKKQIINDPRFGATEQERQKLLFDGGLRIYTTIDLQLQAQAEQAVADVLTEPGVDPEAAVVSIEPRTGYVRAMVGGRDYFGTAPTAKCNLAIGCKARPGRGTGSAFKPIVLAEALRQGIPLTEVLSAPGCITLPVPGTDQLWSPCNADPGEGAPGGTNLVEGTVESFNTLYAQLILQVGPQQAVDLAKRLGITTPLQAVPAAVLGSNDATVLDMASVYATFANRGVRVAPTLITKVTTADGSVLYEAAHEQQKVLDAPIADQVSQVLTQVIERGTGTAAKLDRPAAGKTGTGQDYRNAWFCGYTPDLATAVWVGFPSEELEMRPPNTRITVYGGTWPAQIWQRFMSAALSGVPARDFPVPATTTTAPSAPSAPAAPTSAVVPDVAGMASAEARATLNRAGFSVASAPVLGSGRPAGTVAGQSPAAGTTATTGSAVTIEVEAGPEGAVSVPDVLGATKDRAASTLAAAGFAVGVRQDPQPGFDGREDQRGRVWKQSPAAGTKAAKGAVVTVTANPP